MPGRGGARRCPQAGAVHRPITNQEMIHRLIHALVGTKNEAADTVLLEALRLGIEREQGPVLDALLRRKTVGGLSGVISCYDKLPASLQLRVLDDVKLFHHALRECGRSSDTPLRIAAMKLIALGRQGKLAYVLSENLHEREEGLSKTAVEAMVALGRWVATETKRLQKGAADDAADRNDSPPDPSIVYNEILGQRDEI